MQFNPINNTDSYKYSHYKQYPAGTEYVYSYIESRGGEYDATIMFGLQAFIKEYLMKPFTMDDINKAEKRVLARGLTFNRAGFEYILKRYNGYFPVRIRAVPEGTLVPTGNILADIINTDPVVPFATSFLETSILRAVWYGTTVATSSYYLRESIVDFLEATADESALGGVGFKLNDFGSRGASSRETCGLGGMAHLISFLGSDNDVADEFAEEYYGAEGPIGFSIPAAEHSTMTSWGGRDGEIDAMRNMIKQFAVPGALVAVVSDSYDIWNAVDNMWGGTLLEEVKNSGATIVVRPDSGDPLTVPVQVIQRLMDKVGYEVNSKGYKMLPSYFRVIQGDGVNPKSIVQILQNLKDANISTDNIAFGMGGAMLQGVNRDTLKFAMKCSAICVNGVWRDVFKDPITDPVKASKKGLLDLVKEGKEYKTISQGEGWKDNMIQLLRIKYENGKMYDVQTFDDIRNRAAR